jgi:hypothetical protein
MHIGDTIAIGAAAMVGTEKVRIVGILRADDSVNNLAGLELTDGDSLPVSGAGTGRLRYNGATNSFESSVNGAAYVTLGDSGWTHSGTLVQLMHIGDTIAIGAAAMVGTEKVLISGSLAFNASPGVTGTIRLTDTNNITWFNAATTYGLVSGQGTTLYVGGPYPTRPPTVFIESATTTEIMSGGVVSLQADNTTMYTNVPDFYFGSAVLAPKFYQQSDATPGAVCDTLLIHSQDSTGGGTGSRFELRAGHGATHGVLALMDAGGTDRIYIGNTGNVTIDAFQIGLYTVGAGGYHQFTANAIEDLYMASTEIRIGVPLLYFGFAVIAPKVYQLVDATAGVTGDDLTIQAQDVSDAAGNAFAGNLGLTGGKGTTHANNKDGNIWLHTAPAAWQAMEMGVFVGNAVTAPTGDPVSGGYLYALAGAGTWRGSSATVTTFGAAGPHCSRCGYDAWTVACLNPKWKSWHYVCGHCGAEYKGGPKTVTDLLDITQKQEQLYENMTWEEVSKVLKAA